MKTLVINPTKEKIFESLKEATLLNLSHFLLVGDKAKLIEKCYRYNIDSKLFSIYNITDDFEIIRFSQELILNTKIDQIIFDDFPQKYQNQILNLNDENYKVIDIIDIPFLKHFLFVANISKKQVNDYSDKKDTIYLAKDFMQKLGIKQVNVALISYENTKVDYLEASLVDLHIKKDGNLNIKIYDDFNIYNLFLFDSRINIFNSKINLLVFKKYEASQIYLDTLKIFSNNTFASIILGDVYGIDFKKLKGKSDLLFTLSILEKIYSEKVEKQEKQSPKENIAT